MHRYRMGMWGLHSSVCNAPVPDVLHDHFTGFVKHPVNNPVLSDLIRYSDLDPAIFRVSWGRGFAASSSTLSKIPGSRSFGIFRQSFSTLFLKESV